MITKRVKTLVTVSALAIAGQLSAGETFYVALNGKTVQFRETLKSRDVRIVMAPTKGKALGILSQS